MKVYIEDITDELNELGHTGSWDSVVIGMDIYRVNLDNGEFTVYDSEMRKLDDEDLTKKIINSVYYDEDYED